MVIAFQHREGQFGYATSGRSVENGLTAGMQLTRPLSATRNVTFGFGVGSSAVDNHGTGDLAFPGGRQYLATANVSSGYDFGRSWHAQGSYRRGMEYIAALRAPVFMDGVSVETSGLLSRRTEFRVSAGYSTGAPTIGPLVWMRPDVHELPDPIAVSWRSPLPSRWVFAVDVR